MAKKRVEVVAAVIEKDGLVFCAQRGNSRQLANKWEFPGGKIEGNETKEQALAREIYEELNSVVLVGDHLITVEHEYETFFIILHAFSCILLKGDLELSEHINKKWVKTENMMELDWAPADLPIVSFIMSENNKPKN